VGHNKQTSGELLISFCTKFENRLINFFNYPKDALLMYLKFDYKLQKSTLITFTRWLPWRIK